jgi:hypothetical protein
VASGSDVCSIAGFQNLEDMWMTITNKGVELGHGGRRFTSDGNNPLLMLVLFLDLDVFRKERNVLVMVTVEHKFQTAGTRERGSKERDCSLDREAVDLEVERLTRAGLVVDLCRDTCRNATEERDVIGGSCFRNNLDYQRRETF